MTLANTSSMKSVGSKVWLTSFGLIMMGICRILRSTAPSEMPLEAVIYGIGFTALSLAIISFLWSRVIKSLRQGKSSGLSGVFLTVAFVTFIGLTATFIASGGDIASSYSFLDSVGGRRNFLWLPSVMILALVPFCLLGWPDALRRRLDFEEASEFTRNAIISVTNMCALLAAAGYLMFQHFFRGPLGKIGIGPLIAATLASLALLAPIFRSVIKSVWQAGRADFMDPAVWRVKFNGVAAELAGTKALADTEAKGQQLSASVKNNQAKSPAKSKLHRRKSSTRVRARR